MNTRLQVEHPVTEMITGLDLVELMIRVAAGEKLPLTPGRREAERLGHREPRLCRGPVPQLHAVDRAPRALPAGRPSSRANTCASTPASRKAAKISMFYDPMIAKLVTYGADREQAIAAMHEALDAYAIRGVNHNISRS